MDSDTKEAREVGNKQPAAIHSTGELSMKVVEFLFASAYDVVTWILIALCAGTLLLFVAKENWRAVMWAGLALICCGLVMIALQADRYLFRSRGQAVGSAPTPPVRKGLSEAVRPYLFVYATLGSSSLNQVTPILLIENRGATPARNIEITGEIIYPEPSRKIPEDMVKLYNTAHIGFLGAGDEITLENVPDPTVLDKRYLRDIKRGNKIFVIRVAIAYEDLGDGSYPAEEYCFEYNRKLNESSEEQFTSCISRLAREKAKAHNLDPDK